jgi:pimeloyl-ACP methyl ester carboxylesterase
MPYATVNPNGHRIHYHDTKDVEPERGSGKPPILMIHGLGSSQNYYMPVIGHLPQYRCIALDTYGAARSKSQGEKLTLEQLAEDVVGLMDHLKIEKVVLVGHSMGGTMVCHVSAAHPDRVLGTVSIGPVNPKSVKPEAFTSRIEIVSKDGMEPLANMVPTSATNAKSTPLQKAIIRELIIGQDPKSYASHCEVILNMQEPKGGFEAVKRPVLIIAGEEDKSAPLEGCQYIQEHLASADKNLLVLDGVGHWHCVEAGERVAQEIHGFCGRI